MKKQFGVILFSIIIFFSISQNMFSQFELNIERCNNNLEVIALIDTVFLSGIEPQNKSNITFIGDPYSVGYFSEGYIFGFERPEGIVMSTGFSESLDDSNTCSASNASGNTTGGPDPDLSYLSGSSISDACIIEFDFKPIIDTVRFNYVFGSEEYHDYVGSSFNDVFGFFLSGYGINGPFTNNAINIALIPETTSPVSISNVNCGNQTSFCTPPPGGNNCEYLYDNTDVSNGTFQQTVLDAFTSPFIAESQIQFGEWYHIKLAIGDAWDPVFDSGIFLERGSFYTGIVTAVSENEFMTHDSRFEDIKLFPNPAKDYITLEFNLNKETACDINIYNQLGQNIYEVQSVINRGKVSQQINIESLPSGLYFVNMITSNKQVYQSKFEIIK